MQHLQDDSRTKKFLLWSFGGIIVLLTVAQVLMNLQWHAVPTELELITANSLTSIRLVERMGSDVERERGLIGRHIFEQVGGSMDAIESAIEVVRSELVSDAKTYAPLATLPDEASAWRKMSDDIAVEQKQTAAALQLSRANRDVEANKVMIAAEPFFDAVDRDVTNIVEINQGEAFLATARISKQLKDALHIRFVVLLTVIMATLFIGLAVTRMIARTERRLILQAAALENRNRELDAFAGRVSHDLRGPLNTISLAASMLAERAPPGDSTPGILRRGVNQMASLVDDLLALSRLGVPTVGASALTVPVAASIKDDLGPLVNEVGGSLRVDVEPASVRCSEGLLRQVLWNIGENAVKYRRPNVTPNIELLGRCTARGYQFRISDNGAGMSADDVRHAFEPFFRGEHNRAIPGTGLGLAIVRRIIEASGGTVSIDSRIGQGTTFVIELPLGSIAAT